jgi:hypothetical protein
MILIIYYGAHFHIFLQVHKPTSHGVLDLTSQGAAEVPIPVLTDESDGDGGELSGSTPASSNKGSRPIVPAISITKPPAPLPVELPTAHDIVTLPSPPDSALSFDDDLEAGRRDSMREIPRERLASQRPSQGTVLENAEPRSEPSPEVELVDLSPTTLLSTAPDLLTDAAPALETAAIAPSTLGNLGVASSDGQELEDVEDSPEAHTTVRLVGGGGVVGSADATSIPSDNDVLVDESTSDDTTLSKGKHEKKSSITSGLKKLGNISGGGKRKKHLDSSAKGDVAN